MAKKTLIIGASENPERYSNKAIRSLVDHGHPVVAIGLKPGTVAGITFTSDKSVFEGIHTVSLYIGSKNQSEYYDYIESLNPQRVVFNPGTENLEFKDRLTQKGIETTVACTLVLLATGQF